MPLAGPFTCLDYTATPTQQPDGLGGTVSVYPALAGVFYICDPATYAASRAALDPYKVTAPKGADGVSAQHIMGGDDAENVTQTITFSFPDQATADPVVAEVAATPVPTSPPPSDPSPLPPRTLSRIDFIERFPEAVQMELATSVDPVIVAAHFKLLAVSAIELDATSTQQLVGYLVQQGKLSPEEAAVVLA